MTTAIVEHMGVRWGTTGTLPWTHSSHRRFFETTSKVCAIGSCFAVNFGRWISMHGVKVFDPGWGMHYNPSTIRQELAWCLGVSEDQVTWRIPGDAAPLYVDGLRHPIHANALDELRTVRERIRCQGRAALENASAVIITLGLSEVWEETIAGRRYILNRTPPTALLETNCFSHRSMSVDECKICIRDSLELIRSVNQDCTIVFTVSPVPLKTSFKSMDIRIANHASKAVLYAAVHEILAQDVDNVVYFPAYDMFMASDDPERLWQLDRRHPTAEAVDDVCRQFIRLFAVDERQFERRTDFTVKQVQKVQDA